MEVEIVSSAQGQVLGEYRRSWERVELVMGPLGSGKTIETCQKVFDAMCRQAPGPYGVRPSRWVAVRNTYPDLTSTTIKDWLSLYGEIGTYRAGGVELPSWRSAFELDDGTEVETELLFLALDRPDAVKKLRGVQATGFWLNEVKELSKSVVDMADLRHGRYPSLASGGIRPSWHGMLGDYNPPDEDHWLYKLAEEERPEGWVFHRQPGGLVWSKELEQWVVNPDAENLRNLPPNYYKAGMAGKDHDWIAVNLGGEYGFVKDGKPVHPAYVDSVHCLREEYKPDPKLPILIGMDFGRTPAAALVQALPVGRYVAFDEFVGEDISAAQFAPEFKRWLDSKYPGFGFSRGGGDPSGGSGNQSTDDTPFAILRSSGILCVFPTATNEPLIRRKAVSDPLTRLAMDGKPGLMISPRCMVLRKGLAGGFCYRRVLVAGEPRYHDKPDKTRFSHVVEALEYALQQAGEGRPSHHMGGGFTAPVQAAGFSPF